MPDGQVLEFAGLTKRFGQVLAVDGLTARAEPGDVTGFLGPNGAGKTTTLRMLVGLVRPTSGTATIGGVQYARLPHPMRTIGAAVEASSFHPGRTAANHLKVCAQAAEIPLSRVDETLGMVGLSDVAGRKVGGFSMGMRQRLGLAEALLGDPDVLVLDEPTNGLDPEGITWMRGLLRALARQGRTVLVSSHLLAEVQQVADRLLIISRGRLVFQGALHELTDTDHDVTVVDSPDRAALSTALTDADIAYEVLRSGLTVRNADTATVGRAAAAAGVALSSLQRRGPALEEVFFDLVNRLRVHPSAQGVAEPAAEAEALAAAPDASADAPVDPAPAAEAAMTDAAPEPEPAPVPEPAQTPDAAEAPEPVPAASASDADGASFAVASTGVIDAIPTPEHAHSAERARQAEPAHSDGPAREASDDLPEEHPTQEPADQQRRHTYSVAATGVIDIVPGDASDPPAPDEASDPPAPDDTEPRPDRDDGGDER